MGFDTIAFYVPNTLDWAAGKAGFLEMLGTDQLKDDCVCFLSLHRLAGKNYMEVVLEGGF